MRTDDNKMFDNYVASLLEESKKTKKTKKEEDKKEDKKLPPWLKKKGKKTIKESHESLGDEILNMTVSELLDKLQSDSPDLYKQLEAYLGVEPSEDSSQVLNTEPKTEPDTSSETTV